MTTKKQQNELNTPWSLHFDRDGTEDIAVICDADGADLVYSRHFWLPESNDSVPPTLAAVRLLVAAPKLFVALRGILARADETGRIEFHRDSQDARAAEAALAEATGPASAEPNPLV